MKQRIVDDRSFKAAELYPGVWRIQSCFVNMYLIIGAERVALVDTGYGFADLSAFVRKITDKPLTVLLTHGHLDHGCGIRQFDCNIYLHPADGEVLHRHNQREVLETGFLGAKMERLLKPWRRPIAKDFDRNAYFAEPQKPVKDLIENMVFDLGGITLRAVELPGHTPGSVGFLLPEYGIIFAGDAMNGNLFLQFPESTPLSVYKQTLYKAKTLDFATILQGHGGAEPKSRLDDFIYVAEHLDFSTGKIQKGGIVFAQSEIRNCRDKSRHAGIVIAEEKL